MAAHHPQRVIHAQHDRQAQGEHPQRFNREIRNHPVIHVHREQGQRQREQVDQQGRRQDVPVKGQLLPDHPPEPVADRLILRRRAPVEQELGTRKNDETGIPLGERRGRQRHGAFTGVGKQKVRLLTRVVPTEQNAGAPIVQQQDRGQQRRIDAGKRPPHQPGREAGARGGATEQGGGEACPGYRQPRCQAGPGAGAPMDASQFDQAVEQWIWLELVLTCTHGEARGWTQ